MERRGAWLDPEARRTFAEDARRAIYEVIALRRDVRHFVAQELVADDVLLRILGAAHQAPSVGLSQPWGFVVVRDRTPAAAFAKAFCAVARPKQSDSRPNDAAHTWSTGSKGFSRRP